MGKKVLLVGVDGYIGNALVQRLLYKGYSVVGVDNLMRRANVKKMGSDSATFVMDMESKAALFNEIGDFTWQHMDLALYDNSLEALMSKFTPDIIMHLGHQPSGPYSMQSMEASELTLRNNILSTNRLLWAIKNHCPEAHYITIGTTGEYDHYSNIDIEEGYITIEHNGRKSNEMIYPRRPGSIYHSSKTGSTYLIDFVARSWGIRCTDVQQSVVFGCYTDEIDETKVYSRFDSDEAFGTVVNRFVVQSLLGVPLTVYGEGHHQRGFISLNDSVQALMLAVENPADKGYVQVWNQLSEWHSMNDIAAMVVAANPKASITHIATPRNEHTGEHYYNYVTTKLRALGYEPTRTIEEEIAYSLRVVGKRIDKIQKLKAVVIPKIKWS